MSLGRFVVRYVAAMALVIGSASLVLAGTTGKLEGVVKDMSSGLPMPGANVVVVGTTMGAATTEDGKFFILNVPAGTYSVQVTVMGYKPVLLTDVLVTPDFTTPLDFSIEPSVALTVETVQVSRERPLIQRDATSSVRVIDSEEYSRLPTRGYQDAVAVGAGVVGSLGSAAADIQGNESTNNQVLFVRGGRANEVAYFVDGFSQQDPLTGYSTTSINTNAVEQVVVLTGGFNAEYGRIMSGAVNVVTKDGRGEYFGSFDVVTDNLGGDWVGTTKFDYNVYSASLGGPVLPGNDKLTFFASGERRWYGDRSPRSFNVDLVPDYAPQELQDGIQPNNQLSGLTWQGKLSWKVSPKTTLKFGTLGSQDDWQEYLHTYALNIDHTPRYEDRNNSVFGTLTQSLGANAFVDVKVNWFKTERKRGDGIGFDELLNYARYDSSGTTPVGNPRFDQYETLFWNSEIDSTVANEGHVFDDYLERKSSYVGFAADYTSQLNVANTLKVGGDFQRHSLRLYRNLFPVQAALDSYDDTVHYGYDEFGNEIDDEGDDGFDDGVKNPIVGSFYVQNSFDVDNFILTTGLRYDRLDPKTAALVNPDRPFGDRSGDASLDPEDLTDSNAQDKISPRLAIGFPISDGMQFHANYGRFYQQPNLEDLYTSYRFLEHKINPSSGGYYFPFGNPNLEPQETIAYEMGIAKALADDVRLDVTAYYKDVKDLVEVASIPSTPTQFSSFRNNDYGTIKGVDLALTMRDRGGISGTMNYSLSWAKGTGSRSQTQRDIAWQSEEPPRQSAPLAFDQRHKLSIGLDVRGGEEAGPLVAGFFPLANSGANFLLRTSSGFPYTPIIPNNVITLGNISEEPTGPINSVYGPWTFQLDAKATRKIPVAGLDVEAYVWILNLLDTQNSITVYTSSGDAETTTWLSSEEGRVWAQNNGPEGVELYNFAENDPTNFGSPRIVRFGLKVGF